MIVERCTSQEHRGWLELRSALWPDCPESEHLEEMAATCANPEWLAAFIAYGESGDALGLIEAAVRTDYVNGTSSSPVGFVEGLYVVVTARHQGIARKLVAAAEGWVRECGCHEMASDALLENTPSHAVHHALGFTETERVVYFTKKLSSC